MTYLSYNGIPLGKASGGTTIGGGAGAGGQRGPGLGGARAMWRIQAAKASEERMAKE